jgi:hypothetical protein
VKAPLMVSLLLAASSVARGQTLPVDLSTCIALGGGLNSVGAPDPKWQVKLPGSSNSQQVRCANGSLIDTLGNVFPNTWASDPHARWLSPYIDNQGNATSLGAQGTYIYTMTFVAPDCTASMAQATFNKLGGDNTVDTIFVNQTPYALSAPFNPLASPTVSISPGQIVSGINTIEIHVDNYDTYTGLFVYGGLTITYPDCPSVGVNKDLRNNTGQPANGIEILLAGSYTNVNHYDGYPSNVFATFSVSPSGGNTLLSWSNPNNPVQPGQIAHVGFNLLGATANILGVSWALNGRKTSCAQQVSTNTHLWGSPGSQIIYANNGVSCESVPRYVGGLKVEWYARRVPLANLNPRARRRPIRSDVIKRPPIRLEPNATARINVPQAPRNATFGVIVQKVSANAKLTGPDVITDFLEFPVQRETRKPPTKSP